ncbi:hypothetical protein MTO96_023461 [Rhipicephalus appendiculatus]
MGRAGVSHIIFWNVYIRMLPFLTPGKAVRNYDSPTEACYDRVAQVLKEALITPYLLALLPPETVEEARKLLHNIRNAVDASMLSSSWFIEPVKTYARGKLKNMTFLVATPDYVNLTLESIEEYYKDLPDTDMEHLFPSWIKARAVSARLLWVAKTTFIFDFGKANAYYYRGNNAVVVPAASLTRPSFYPGIDPLNYGASGTITGHEIMHGFDVMGIMGDERGLDKNWTTAKFLKDYTKRVLCLRASHQAAEVTTALGGCD